MTANAIGMRQMMYSDGRPDEFFELETETQCEHRLTGNGPSFRIANRVATRGVCIWCANTYVEETDTRDHGVQFFRKKSNLTTRARTRHFGCEKFEQRSETPTAGLTSSDT